MKWYHVLGTIVLIGALTQFINWILKSIIKNIDETLIFFISLILTLLIVAFLILIDIQKEIKIMKQFLEKKGYKESTNEKNGKK